ncbi:unnamed protein product [Rotaria magnacalcarata]|uniref:Uncharacterized protein n=2 Tax=Rotaria magnacalcarata TaxID=392030 RepID=A0A815K9L1_9BILA|nr:unnamed protein product [Rotaria magnacalcarata]
MAPIKKLIIDNIRILTNNEIIMIGDMVLLESSNKKEESFHMILADANIRFLNNNYLYSFVTETLRMVLLANIDHDCLRKTRNVNCCITPSIDLKVYNKEQDFRMFTCTKLGETRPLKKSSFLVENILNCPVQDLSNHREISTDVLSESLQKSLITQPGSDSCFYIDHHSLRRWMKFDRNNTNINDVKCIELKDIENKNAPDIKKNTIMYNVKNGDELYAQTWTESYLTSIGSHGVVHSINTVKNGRFIMCNIRNMNTCTTEHTDYFNDSTVFINIKQKEFAVRCNRIPCNKKSWIWHSMN